MKLAWILFAFAAFAQTPAEVHASPAELQRASLAKQRTAAQAQAAAAGAWLKPWDERTVESGPVLSAACDPLEDSVVAPLIADAAKQQSVEPKLLRAVIEQESAFRPCAVSPKGAQGLMQLMPATAQQFAVTDALDPKQNIDAGAKYLKQLLNKYGGDLPQTLAAYNSGPGTTDQAGAVPDIPETKAYVEAILQKLGIKRTDQPSIQMPKPIGN